MKQKGFLGGLYKTSVVNWDGADCINLYPEMDEIGTGKEQEVLMLRSRPGLTLLHQIPATPVRCIWQTQGGNIYVVAGSGLFWLQTTDGVNYTHTLIGTLTTSTGRVYMTDGIPNTVNGQLNTARVVKVVVVDGSKTGLVFTDGQTAMTQMTAGNGYAGSAFVTFQDGFFLFSQPGTPVAYFASDPMNISGQDTIVVNLGPDIVERVLSDHDIVWVFGQKTSSVWQNTGGVGFFTPNNLFQQIPGSFSEGSAFPHTVCKLGGQLIWLMVDPNGSGQVFEAVGYRGARISTHAEEQMLSQAGDLTNATAWVYQAQGHSFYCLNVPGMSQTLCYDIITKMWTTRAFFNNGQFSRDLVEYHYALNLPNIGQLHMVGDLTTGNLYKLDDTNYTDNGYPIYRQRTTPHMSSAFKRMQLNELQIDIEEGVGASGLGVAVPLGPTTTQTLTASSNPLSGSGPTYQFTANDGSLVVPLTSPTPVITSSGPYSNSYSISGGTITFYPAPITIPLEQIGLGDGATTSFNLTQTNGNPVTSVTVYASDWRGNLLQSTTPRTNLCPYSIDFNKGWVAVGTNPAPSAAVTTGAGTGTQVLSPTPITPTVGKTDVTSQLGWSNNLFNTLTTYRPSSKNSPDGATLNTSGSGLPTGNSTTITTSGPNYVYSQNSLVLYSPNYNGGSDIVTPNSGVFTGFGTGSALTGNLIISVSTVTSQSGISNVGAVGNGKVEVQYMADGMTAWSQIAQAVGGNDMSSSAPLNIPLTVANLTTLQVRIVQTGEWNMNVGNADYSTNLSANVTAAFSVYDIAFLGGTQYVLNAPDGTPTGTALVEDGTWGYHNISTTYNSIAGNPVTMSMYALAGDPTRNFQMQLGTGSNIIASSVFNLNNGTVASTAAGSAAITPYTSAIPSTGTILVDTLLAATQTGLTAQVAPSVLAIPLNGVVTTYAWSFTQGAGTITSGATTPLITFNVGAAGNYLLQLTITSNNVPTIYTQYITVVATTNVYRISVSGTEVLTGQNTATLSLVNTSYFLTYNDNPTEIIAPFWTGSGGAAGTQAVFISPTIASSGATNLVAQFGWYDSRSTYNWYISNGTITSFYRNACIFSVGTSGICTVSVKVAGGTNGTFSQTIQITPSKSIYYPGNTGGWVGIWGCQIEESASASALIETVGVPLTDMYTLNATTGNIIFGVAPLDDAVLTASFVINAISANPVQFFWSGQYQQSVPGIIYLGTNPQLWLSWSDDGGHSWNPPRSVSMGQIGAYRTRCIYRRLGQTRDRVWRIQCSDPVRLTLIGHEFTAKVSKK